MFYIRRIMYVRSTQWTWHDRGIITEHNITYTRLTGGWVNYTLSKMIHMQGEVVAF